MQSGAGLRTAALVGPGHRIPILYGRCLITPDIVRASMANYRAEFDVVLSEGPISAVESWLTDPGTLEATTLSLGSLSPTAGLPSWSIGLACARLRTAAGRPYQPRCIARGRKLYDPRLGSWGAGTYPDAAHCAYSTNPALAFVDATLFPQYGYAYPRVPPSLIDWTSVADAADWCDDVVAGEKRYELNIFLQAGSDSSVWLDTIRLHAGLRWRDEEGLLRLDYSAPVATVLDAITDDHIVADSKPRLVYGSGAGLKDRPNRFRAEWIDPASDWSVRTVEIHHPEVDAGAAIRDAQVYKLHGFQSEAQTLRALWRIAHEIWSEVELEAQLTAERLDIVEGARVPVILPSLGLSGAEFLVTKVTYETDTVTIAGRRYDPDTWTPPGSTSGPLPGASYFDTPPALANASLKLRSDVTVEGATTKTRGRPGVLYDIPTFAFSKQLRVRCAIAEQNMVGSIAGVGITSGGSGYAVNDTVTISGEGSGATAKVTSVSSGAITSVTVLTAGSGYWPQTTFVTAGGAGTGAVLFVSIAASNATTGLTWDSPDLARNEFVLPLLGNEPQTNPAKVWGVIAGLVAAFDDTTAGDFFNGGAISGGSYDMRLMVRLESLAGLLGAASTFDQAGSSYSSTSVNPVEPVYHLSDLTANKIPKANASGDGRLVDSKFSDDGSTPRYDGAEILRVGGDIASAGVVTGLLGKGLDSSIGAPNNGDVAVYDSTLGKWKAAAPSGGGVMRAIVYTSGTNTWTAPAGLKNGECWVSGSGGGGGGAGRKTSGATVAGGGGGGAQFVFRLRLAVTAGTGYSTTIGAGGTAGTNSSSAPTNGGTGGSTTFGALLTLGGGAGGQTGGGGGAAGGAGGQPGGQGEALETTYDADPVGGRGGLSGLGGYGCGGDGASTVQSNARAGADGWMLIEWNE